MTVRRGLLGWYIRFEEPGYMSYVAQICEKRINVLEAKKARETEYSEKLKLEGSVEIVKNFFS